MKKLKLTCTYAAWKKKQRSQKFGNICEDTARMLELAFKGSFMNKELSEEEKSELDELDKSTKEDIDNARYTELCHEITDKCLNPTKDTIDYEEIGKLQYEVERMKYPCVIPEDECINEEL